MITINFSLALEQRKGLSIQGPRKCLSEICAQQFLRPRSQSQATEHGAWNDSKPERCDTAQVQLFVVSETMALLVISEKVNQASHLTETVCPPHTTWNSLPSDQGLGLPYVPTTASQTHARSLCYHNSHLFCFYSLRICKIYTYPQTDFLKQETNGESFRDKRSLGGRLAA